MAFTLRQESADGFTTKGSALTYVEGDNNFIGLYDRDDLRLALTGGTLTGDFDVASGLILSGGTELSTLWGGGGGGATELNGLTDVYCVNSGGSAWDWTLLMNAASVGGAPQHGTISDAKDNYAIGGNALKILSTGDYNIAFGNAALEDCATGSGNVALGHNAGNNITGNGSICIGQQSGTNIIGGILNTIIGYTANVTSGGIAQSLALGYGMITTQSSSLALGTSGKMLLHGEFATATDTKLGINLGNTWTAPTATLHVKSGGLLFSDVALLITDSSDNQLMKLTSAGDNICIGKAAGDSITGGGGLNNVCIGLNAGTGISASSDSVAIGGNALTKTHTGLGRTVAIGYNALFNATSRMNTAIGYNAGLATNSGEKNVYIGYDAGAAVTIGNNNIAIGTSVNLLNIGSNQICIGSGISTTAGDSFYMGKLGVGFLHGEYAAAGQTKLGINLGTAYVAPTATLHVKGGGTTSGTTSLLVEDSGGNDILKITDDKRLVYTDGNEAAGYVLTSDANGIGTWQAGGGGGATDLDGLTDAKVVAGGGTALQYSIFLANGTSAGSAAQSGILNVAKANLGIGPSSLKAITEGDYNICVGYNTGQALTTSAYNVVMGYSAGPAISTGAGGNTIIGAVAGEILATGVNNVAVGISSLALNIAGEGNVAIGKSTLSKVTYRNNIGIGNGAGGGITTGQGNTAIGYSTMTAANTNSFCVVMGYSAEPSTTSVSYEYTLGLSWAGYLMRGNYATTGQSKLMINPSGADVPSATLHVKGGGTTYDKVALLVTDSSDVQLMKLTSAGDNICIGKTAGDSITGGGGLNNVCIGLNAGTAITSGDDNICIGYYSGALGNTVHNNNVYIGRSSGISNAAENNVCVGFETFRNASAATKSVAIGYRSLYNVADGNNNIAIGYQSGDNITTGENNIIIGHDVDASSATVSNELNIGGNIIGSMAAADRHTRFSGQTYTETVVLAAAATVTPNFTNGNVFSLTIDQATLLENPTNPKDGGTYMVVITQDGTGGRTMTYGTNYKWEGGTAPTLSIAAGAVDILTFVSDGTNMYGLKALNFS